MIMFLLCIFGLVEPQKIPHTKEETAVIKLKADPGSYVGKEVVLCGTIELDDYYNYSYINSEDTHLSFSFRELGGTTATRGREAIHIYAPRNAFWTLVTDYIAKAAEKDPSREAVAVARVKVRLNPDLYARDKQWDMLDAVDIQFIEPDYSKWSQWIGDIAREAQAKRDAEAKKKKLAAKAEADAEAAAEKAKEDALNELKWRDWMIGGKTVRARYNGISSGVLKVAEKDGTIHKLPIDKLTKTEQDWLKAKPWMPSKKK